MPSPRQSRWSIREQGRPHSLLDHRLAPQIEKERGRPQGATQTYSAREGPRKWQHAMMDMRRKFRLRLAGSPT